MAFIPVPHGIEVAIHATQGGQELVNVIGFKNSNAAPSVTEVTDAMVKVAAFVDDYALLISSSVHFYKLVGTALDSPQGAQVITSISVDGGVSASQPMPQNVAAVINLHGVLRGRGSVGRIYWFGLTESDVDGDLLVSGTIDDIAVTFANLPFAPDASGNQFAIIKKKRTAGPIADPVVNIQVDTEIGSQRLRLPGRKKRKH